MEKIINTIKSKSNFQIIVFAEIFSEQSRLLNAIADARLELVANQTDIEIAINSKQARAFQLKGENLAYAIDQKTLTFLENQKKIHALLSC